MSVESAETKNKKKEGEQKNKNTENGTYILSKKVYKKEKQIKNSLYYYILYPGLAHST